MATEKNDERFASKGVGNAGACGLRNADL